MDHSYSLESRCNRFSSRVDVSGKKASALLRVKQSAELAIPIPDGRAAHESAYLPGPRARGAVRPRIVRMSAEWWDSPPAVSCPLSRGLQSARAARRLTSSTLCDWGLMSLAEDAETIVGELAANALAHAVVPGVPYCDSGGENLCLRLLRGPSEVICSVLDPSDTVPVLQAPGGSGEAGRGLQIVDALSDVWGWSPMSGRGKAVWAILFSAYS